MTEATEPRKAEGSFEMTAGGIFFLWTLKNIKTLKLMAVPSESDRNRLKCDIAINQEFLREHAENAYK